MLKPIVIGALIIGYLYLGHHLRKAVGWFWAYIGMPLGMFYMFAHW